MVFRVQRCQLAEEYVTFYRLHMAYILFLSCLGTFILWLIPLNNSKRMPLISALYTSVSVVASTGLQTVESASLTYTHYIILVFLMMLANPITTSLLPLFVRRYYFHLCIKQYALERSQLHKLEQHELEMTNHRENEMKINEDKVGKLESFHEPDDKQPAKTQIVNSSRMMTNSDAEFYLSSLLDYAEELERKERVFVDAQQALRTLEYRALVALSRVIVRFLFAASTVGFVLGVIYFVSVGGHEKKLLEKRGINPYFYAMFTSFSAFSNTGYCMTNDNMLPFVRSSAFLLLYAVLASVGNTLYGPLMRFLVWVCYKRAPDKEKSVYDYLLKHPRRCYTYLFPRYQTLWLVGVYFLLTGFQLFFMSLLEWGNALGGLTTMEKLAAAFYQGVSTRNAGGLAVNLSQLAPALLFIIVAFMYISVYPVFLSRQTTQEGDSDSNYDESYIGIYKDKVPGPCKSDDETVVVNQSRRLLARDTTYLFIAMFILCLSESKNIKIDPLNYSIFNIVFEVTSAFGNIGLSMGYDCGLRLEQDSACNAIPYSFSGAWSTVGRLTIIAVMFMGRHRGLADNIDSAIRLPTRIVPHTMPSTPRRPSNASNSPLPPSSFAWTADAHQQQVPSPPSLSKEHSSASLEISALSLHLPVPMSDPCDLPPTPTLASPPPPHTPLALPSPSPTVVAAAAAAPEDSTSAPRSSPFPSEINALTLSLGEFAVSPSDDHMSSTSISESSAVTPSMIHGHPIPPPPPSSGTDSNLEARETAALSPAAALCQPREAKSVEGETNVQVTEHVTASSC
ncbi:hypothetical protein AXG93_2550s1420 [Marchantia polymorpha subsp. ruderalis]|nr:hypothetical protein AXG93_2550s1420 [Marchantia polymorpha subsp. ruderalis]